MRSIQYQQCAILLIVLSITGSCAPMIKNNPKDTTHLRYTKVVGRRGPGLQIDIDEERNRFVQSTETDIQMNAYYLATRHLHEHIVNEEIKVNEATTKIIDDIKTRRAEAKKKK